MACQKTPTRTGTSTSRGASTSTLGPSESFDNPDVRFIVDAGHAAHSKGRCRLVLKHRLERLRKAVIAYIEYYNLKHEYRCPEDDTCDCALVQDIEKALKEGT